MADPHVQITDVATYVSYSVGSGGSTGPFSIPFPFFATGDIKVKVDDTLLAAADYTVTGTAGYSRGYPGGSLTLDTTVYSKTVTIYREVEAVRTSDQSNSGPLEIPTLNTDLDKGVAFAQDLRREVTRGVVVPLGETGPNFPGLTDRKNSGNGGVLYFDGTTGDMSVTPPSTDSTALALTYKNDAEAAAASVAFKLATNRAAMQALDTAQTTAVRIYDEGLRNGVFVFSSSNHAGDVTNDTAQGVYVPPSSDTTGASGAWVRQKDSGLNIGWFGAVDGADSTTAITGAIAFATYAGEPFIYVPSGTFLTNDATFPSTVYLKMDGILSVNSGKTVIVNGPLEAPIKQIFAGAGSVVLAKMGRVHAAWWGVKADGSTDNSTTLQAAINGAQATGINATLVLGAGVTCYSAQQVIANSNNGITIEGVMNQASQQGSKRPASVLRWTGGLADTFSIQVTDVRFAYLAIENTGGAQRFAQVTATGAGRLRFWHVDAVAGGSSPSSVPFVSAFVRTPASNYDRYEHCEFTGIAPRIIDIDNTGNAGGYTTLTLNDCIIDSYYDTIVVKVTACSGDLIRIKNCTFNGQATSAVFSGLGYSYTSGHGLTIIDLSDVDPGSTGVSWSAVHISDMEYDFSGSLDGRAFKLKNCKNFMLDSAQGNCNGVMTSFVDLTNSIANVVSVNFHSLAGPVFTTLDSLSRVYALGSPNLDSDVTGGLVNSGSTGSGIVTMTAISATVNVPIKGNLGSPSGFTSYTFTPPDNQAYTIYPAKPTDSTYGYMTRGQKVRVWIINSTGGVLGASVFRNTDVKTNGALTMPANGNRRWWDFEWDGTWLREVARAGADIAN